MPIANIQRFCSANKISKNYSKTTYSIYSRGVTNDYTEIAVGSHKISRTYASKYLGVIIDEKLTWSNQIDYIYNKQIKFVGIAYRLRNKIPAMFLRNIYYGLIHSNILYGLEIYGNASHSQVDKLIKLNNKILRILQFKTILKPATWLFIGIIIHCLYPPFSNIKYLHWCTILSIIRINHQSSLKIILLKI